MSTLGFCVATLAGAVASALVPVINAELLVLGAVGLGPRHLSVLAVLLVTVGQMAGKTLVYLTARGSARLPYLASLGRIRHAQAHGREARMKVGGLVLATSAVVGLPPFYVTAAAAGALRMPFPLFLCVGFGGRLVRFSAIAAFPSFAQEVLS